jgi:hypothetical protein
LGLIDENVACEWISDAFATLEKYGLDVLPAGVAGEGVAVRQEVDFRPHLLEKQRHTVLDHPLKEGRKEGKRGIKEGRKNIKEETK